jgi:hypothetical protein
MSQHCATTSFWMLHVRWHMLPGERARKGSLCRQQPGLATISFSFPAIFRPLRASLSSRIGTHVCLYNVTRANRRSIPAGDETPVVWEAHAVNSRSTSRGPCVRSDLRRRWSGRCLGRSEAGSGSFHDRPLRSVRVQLQHDLLHPHALHGDDAQLGAIDRDVVADSRDAAKLRHDQATDGVDIVVAGAE